MINETLQKIKETSEAIASIAKSFSTIIASLVASMTAIYTGFIEVKKFTHPMTTQSVPLSEAISEKKVVKKTTRQLINEMAQNINQKHNLTATTKAVPVSTSENIGYKADSNTVIFVVAIVILPLIWWWEKRKRKNA